MRYASVLTASTLFAFASTIAAAQGDNAAERAAEIRDRELALADAMHARDRQRLEELLAPDYILRSSPDIDRETWIRNAVTLCWGDRSSIDGFHASQQAGVVIAFAGTVGGLGGVAINLAFRQSYLHAHNARAALAGFLAYYAACAAITVLAGRRHAVAAAVPARATA
jgi:nitrate/nitrite transporter NarK